MHSIELREVEVIEREPFRVVAEVETRRATYVELKTGVVTCGKCRWGRITKPLYDRGIFAGLEVERCDCGLYDAQL